MGCVLVFWGHVADFSRSGAGVMTKLDIMDRGTDASAILRNQVIPLRLGYNGEMTDSSRTLCSGSQPFLVLMCERVHPLS